MWGISQECKWCTGNFSAGNDRQTWTDVSFLSIKSVDMFLAPYRLLMFLRELLNLDKKTEKWTL